MCSVQLQFGYDISGKELDDVFKRFKEVAEKKKVIELTYFPNFLIVATGTFSCIPFFCLVSRLH